MQVELFCWILLLFPSHTDNTLLWQGCFICVSLADFLSLQNKTDFFWRMFKKKKKKKSMNSTIGCYVMNVDAPVLLKTFIVLFAMQKTNLLHAVCGVFWACWVQLNSQWIVAEPNPDQTCLSSVVFVFMITSVCVPGSCNRVLWDTDDFKCHGFIFALTEWSKQQHKLTNFYVLSHWMLQTYFCI